MPINWIPEATLSTVDISYLEKAQIETRVMGTEFIAALIAHRLTRVTEHSP